MISYRYQRALLIISLALAAILLNMGWQSSTILAGKATAQRVITEGVYQWQQSFRALREVAIKWDQTFNNTEAVQDLVSLYAMIGLQRYGLQTDADTVILSRVELVNQGTVPIGLTKICLISTKGADQDSLLVWAADYETLFRGLTQLASQPDIDINSISIRGEKNTHASASLGQFCVLLRMK